MSPGDLYEDATYTSTRGEVIYVLLSSEDSTGETLWTVWSPSHGVELGFDEGYFTYFCRRVAP